MQAAVLPKAGLVLEDNDAATASGLLSDRGQALGKPDLLGPVRRAGTAKMILDASAIIAMLRAEPEARDLAAAMFSVPDTLFTSMPKRILQMSTGCQQAKSSRRSRPPQGSLRIK